MKIEQTPKLDAPLQTTRLDRPHPAGMTSAVGTQQHVGTLVWIGPTDRPEWHDAFQYCTQHAAQIAPRQSLEDLLQRPAALVSRIVIVRGNRQPPPPTLATVRQSLPDAECWTLVSSSGEGESRTGHPWPDCQTLVWHRWNQIIPTWFHPTQLSAAQSLSAASHLSPGDTGQPYPQPPTARQLIGLVSHPTPQLSEIIDLLQDLGHSVLPIHDLRSPAPHHLDKLIWDDSFAPPADKKDWCQRIRLAEKWLSPDVATPNNARHCWLVSFPRHQDVTAVQASGVGFVLSKPFDTRALVHWANATNAKLCKAEQNTRKGIDFSERQVRVS